jgi:hypothetical protein
MTQFILVIEGDHIDPGNSVPAQWHSPESYQRPLRNIIRARPCRA